MFTDTDTGNVTTFELNDVVEETNQQFDAEFSDNVEFDQEKPSTSKGWPLLLTAAFLSCFALLFISEIEWKIISASVSLAVIVIALSKILEHEKQLRLWKESYLASLPVESEELVDEAPAKKLRKKKIRRKTVSLKKK